LRKPEGGNENSILQKQEKCAEFHVAHEPRITSYLVIYAWPIPDLERMIVARRLVEKAGCRAIAPGNSFCFSD
jgi:hypothetical protein